MRKFLASFALATLFVMGGVVGAFPAKASTYEVNFTGPFGDFGTLFLDVTGTTVVGISGSTDGFAITGLSSYASADQQWTYPTAPYVDFSGISWSISNGDAFGLGWTGSDYGLAQQSINSNGVCCGDHPLSLTVSETPLPSTWTMLVASLLGLGYFAYRGTKKGAAALAVA